MYFTRNVNPQEDWVTVKPRNILQTIIIVLKIQFRYILEVISNKVGDRTQFLGDLHQYH